MIRATVKFSEISNFRNPYNIISLILLLCRSIKNPSDRKDENKNIDRVSNIEQLFFELHLIDQ